MKAFKLWNPTSVDEVIELLPSRRGPAEMEDARVLAGGQDLLPTMKEHLVEPDELVQLRGVPGLDGIELEGERLHLGAMATLARVAADERVRSTWTAVAEAAESVGSPQIRNQGTVGGNLCQRPRCWYFRNEQAPCIKKGGAECFAASGLNKYNAILGGGPSYIVHPSDLAPALVCLDAEVQIQGPRGERSEVLDRFFTLPSEGSVLKENVLATDELVLAVHVPKPAAGTRSTYLKFKERSSYDWALASVALALRVEGGKIAAASLCLGGVAPIPWRCTSTEEMLVGQPMNEDTWRAAAEDALKEAEPLEHNGYKVPLAKGLILKAMKSLS
jgi:xanthine dehydrogenase YagS FAD-binding subunit